MDVVFMTGPITRRTKSINTISVYMRREWDSQKPPYLKPMYLDYRLRTGKDGIRTFDARSASYDPLTGTTAGSNVDVLKTLAYEKLRDAVSAQAGTMINIVQRQQTVDMMTDRLKQLGGFALAVKRGKFQRAARILGMKKPRGLKHGAKNFGRNFLEFHFGWAPAVSDLYTCYEVLNQPPPAGSVHGRKSMKWRTQVDAEQTKIVRYWTASVRLQMNVSVKNPNLFTANQLGLLNPATVLWDAVPFSFVGDWFGTFGTWLNSLTDFVGLEISKQQTGVKVAVREEKWFYISDPAGTPKRWRVATTMDDVHVKRTLGITGPGIHFRPLKRLSLMRGITACALLLNFLGKDVTYAFNG